MTLIMTQKLRSAIEALEKQPEATQDRMADTIFTELKQGGKGRGDDPYAFLTVLEEAQLEGRPDESVSYEEKLYGLEKEDDV